MKARKSKDTLIKFMAPVLFMLFLVVSLTLLTPDATALALSKDSCGGSADNVPTSIDFGCYQKGNPITDLIFAIIRFLSDGVGLVVIGSVIVGGVQYIGSRGEPNSTSQAINRIRSSIIALVIYIFAYAILNYVIPIGFFKL